MACGLFGKFEELTQFSGKVRFAWLAWFERVCGVVKLRSREVEESRPEAIRMLHSID